MPARPKSLTFIAVVAVVVGVTMALTSLANVLAAKTALLEQSLAPEDGAASNTSAIAAAKAQFQRRSAEIKGRHRGLFLVVLPFALVAGASMIVGGAKAFSLRRWSRPLLMAGMAVALVVELACAKPQIEIGLEMADATTHMMNAVVKTLDGAAGSSGSLQSVVGATAAVTRISATVGVAMQIVFAAAQLAFLVFALIYLARARTRELFAGAAP